MNKENQLRTLLGVYHFSESETYLKFKKLLLKGVTFKFTADKLKPNSSALDYLELLIINQHEHSLDVINGYHELIEYNYKFLLFSDELIEVSYANKKEVIKLSEYLTYQINRSNFKEKTEPFDTDYEITVRLIKTGETRKKSEDFLLKNPEEVAKGLRENILDEMNRVLDSSYFKNYPKRYKVFLGRLSLWGQNIKDLSKDDVKLIVKNFSPIDFGQKDILALYYIKLFISRHNLSNKQLFNLVKKTLAGRINNQKKLLTKYEKH